MCSFFRSETVLQIVISPQSVAITEWRRYPHDRVVAGYDKNEMVFLQSVNKA